MTLALWVNVILVAGLGVAVYTDVTTGKIPNALNGSLLLAGLLVNTAYGDPLFGLLGALCAFAIHFGLFAVQVVRGGDAKLMIGVGALVGWQELIEATFWELFLQVPVGLTILLLRGRIANLYHTLQYAKAKARGEDPGAEPPSTMQVFAPIIAAAVLLSRLTQWLPLPW